MTTTLNSVDDLDRPSCHCDGGFGYCEDCAPLSADELAEYTSESGK